MSATVSTDLDDATAVRARDIAQREQRSMANVVANSVAVFTAFPKDLRDALLDLRAADDGLYLQALTREISALAARTRFDLAARRLAAEGRLAEELSDANDLDLLEAATEMTRADLSRRS